MLATGGVAAAEEPAPAALELGVGGKALFRNLSWHQDPEARTNPYTLSPGPEAGFWLEAYPGAFVTSGLAADLGVFGRYDRGFGVTSSTQDGATVTTSFQDFVAGVEARLPLGAVAPQLSIAYGGQTFRLDREHGLPPIPGFDYRFVRIGAGARIALAPAAFLDAGVGLLFATALGTSGGDVASPAFFPNGKAYGADLDVAFVYRVLPRLGLRASAELRQWGLDFRVKPTDALIVGGAVDRYIIIGAGVELVLDARDRHREP
jgi:hypothetical protein